MIQQTQQEGDTTPVEVNKCHNQIVIPVGETAHEGSDSGEDDTAIRLTGELSSNYYSTSKQQRTEPGSRPSCKRSSSGRNPSGSNKRLRLPGVSVIGDDQAEPRHNDIQPNADVAPSPGTTNRLSNPGTTKTITALPSSVGKSDGEGRSSSALFKIVNDTCTAQTTQTKAQTFSRIVEVLEAQNVNRKCEARIMQSIAALNAREARCLDLEQKCLELEEKRVERGEKRVEREEIRREREEIRREREEKRREREEQRKENDERRKRDEERRNTVMARRKMIIEEANQLRSQAVMYHQLNLSEKTLACVEKVENLMTKLENIRKQFVEQN